MEEKLHHRVKFLMKELGLTQRELAARSGLTEASVSKYLSGARTPQLNAVIALAKALKTDADFLLGINKKEEKKTAYEEIEKLLQENKSSLTSEERMKLIMLLSSI